MKAATFHAPGYTTEDLINRSGARDVLTRREQRTCVDDYLALYVDCLSRIVVVAEAPSAIEYAVALTMCSSLWRFRGTALWGARYDDLVESCSSHTDAQRNAFAEADMTVRLRELHLRAARQAFDLARMMRSGLAELDASLPPRLRVVK